MGERPIEDYIAAAKLAIEYDKDPHFVATSMLDLGRGSHLLHIVDPNTKHVIDATVKATGKQIAELKRIGIWRETL